MKIAISFVDAEREKVMELVSKAKHLFRINRFHEPKPKDGYNHIYLSTKAR